MTAITGLFISGTADADAEITIYEDGTEIATATADGLGAFSSTTFDLAEGEYEITAQAVVNGMTSDLSTPLGIKVDSTAPEILTAVSDADYVVVLDTAYAGNFTAETETTSSLSGTDVDVTDIAGNVSTVANVYTGAAGGIKTAVDLAGDGDLVYIAEAGDYDFGNGNNNVLFEKASGTVTLKGISTDVEIRNRRTGKLLIEMAAAGGTAVLELDTLCIGHYTDATAAGVIGSSTANGTLRLKNIKLLDSSAITSLVDVECAVERWTGSVFAAPADLDNDGDGSWAVGTSNAFTGVLDSIYWQ